MHHDPCYLDWGAGRATTSYVSVAMLVCPASPLALPLVYLLAVFTGTYLIGFYCVRHARRKNAVP